MSVIGLLTMAGHPFVTDIEPLLAALRPAAGVDFGNQVNVAVEWATQTYGIQSSQLRPKPISR